MKLPSPEARLHNHSKTSNMFYTSIVLHGNVKQLRDASNWSHLPTVQTPILLAVTTNPAMPTKKLQKTHQKQSNVSTVAQLKTFGVHISITLPFVSTSPNRPWWWSHKSKEQFQKRSIKIRRFITSWIQYFPIEKKLLLKQTDGDMYFLSPTKKRCTVCWLFTSMRPSLMDTQPSKT